MNSNKLIAEFMGLPTEVFNSGNLNYYFKEFNSGTWCEEHELSYNVSWDWLMPVVEKIESLGYEFTIVESRCKVSNNTDHSVEELFHIETIGSKFKTTYDAVVQFIKNYKTI